MSLRNAFENLSTEAKQDAIIAAIAALPITEEAATDAKLEEVRAILAGIVSVSAESLPLPSGASTEITSQDIKALIGASNDLQQNGKDLLSLVAVLLQALVAPPNFDPVQNRDRVTALLESGTLTTLTTLTTAAELTNINSLQGRLLVLGADMNAWATADRRCIS